MRNATIDIACKNCFTDFDAVACVRSGALGILALITCVMCVFRICRLHWVQHQHVHQYLIFYFAGAECLLCAVNWFLGGFYPQFDFAANYLKFLEFVVICHFHWILAAKILQKESIVDYLIKPVVGIYMLYFTTVVGVGMYDVANSWTQCMKPYWIMLSSGDCLIIQLFFAAGYFITVKINATSCSENVKRTQKRDLWSLIAVFEFSALIPCVYDITVVVLGDEDIGCSGIFGHKQFVYSPIIFLFMLIKFLIPVWTLLAVFKPTPTLAFDDTAFFLGFSATSSLQSYYPPINYDVPFPVTTSPPAAMRSSSIMGNDHTATSYARSASSACFLVAETAAMRKELQNHSDEDLKSLGDPDDRYQELSGVF
ncbi:unnamed protein product [Notodromas monacha]|uniref:Transmembrane protein n=1 Tax=Notodromas monacha TaxID=399045 RepID=A0A7R9GEL7_9CRUS|nr:unnamed protein product [Notodromas monacha]CAG0919750.1 unnamed protein product [Notodromas monacha]